MSADDYAMGFRAAIDEVHAIIRRQKTAAERRRQAVHAAAFRKLPDESRELIHSEERGERIACEQIEAKLGKLVAPRVSANSVLRSIDLLKRIALTDLAATARSDLRAKVPEFLREVSPCPNACDQACDQTNEPHPDCEACRGRGWV